MRRRIKRNRPTPPPSPQIKKVSVARKEISRKKVNRIIRESRNDKPTVRRQPLKLKSNNSFQPNRIEGYVPKKDRIFIIGGGPSVGKINLSLLKDEVTMCVNASVKFVPNPTYFVTMDYSYFEKSKDVGTIQEISDMVDESYFILNVNNPNLIKDHNGIYFDKRNNMRYENLDMFTQVIPSTTEQNLHTGFSFNKDRFVHGQNSGFCAVQLAILLGYKEIVLLGFDLGFDGNTTHFHMFYKNHSNIKKKVSSYLNIFMNSLENFNKTKESESIRLYTGPPSPLHKVIPFVKIDDVIKRNNETGHYVIVSYYTINTPYEKEALKLKDSLSKLNVSYDIVGVKNLGDWQANTRFKAKFMQQMLNKHQGKSVVWVDSDAVIHSYPKLFDTYDCDVAVRWQDFRWRKNECLSGTIYLANNPLTHELCKRWENQNIAEGPNAKTFEQWNLGKVITEMKNEGKIKDENLPPEYTMIFDSMRKMYPDTVPVIEHFQASRKLRNKVKNK